MGHLVGKDLYRELGRKIDGLTCRTPWNETLNAILKRLYTSDEADLVTTMPSGLSSFERLRTLTQRNPKRLQELLDSL